MGKRRNSGVAMEQINFEGPVGIIGGEGRMGRLLGRIFKEAGHQVISSDLHSGPSPQETARSCQVVILAVPIPETEAMAALVGPHTRRDGVLVDITSVKAGPMQAMLANANGAVVGAHPLFGPTAPSLDQQLVFMCPGRGEAWLAWLKNFFQSRGARVREIGPEKHDRLMAQVQSLRHLMLTCMCQTLMQTGFELDLELEFSGPWFKTLMAVLAQQYEQPADLYADISLANQASPQVMRALAQSVDRMTRALEKGDKPEMVAMMETAADYLNGERSQAVDLAWDIRYSLGNL